MNWNIDWDQVAGHLGPRLYKYFCRRGNPNEASDLTQETLLRLFDKVEAGQFDPAKGTLAQFGFGIARLIWLEHAKETQVIIAELTEDYLDSTPLAEQSLATEQTQKQVRQALVVLSPVQRDVLTLVMDEELAMKEISVILSLPENTVKSHIHRAKEVLRHHLKEIWETL